MKILDLLKIATKANTFCGFSSEVLETQLQLTISSKIKDVLTLRKIKYIILIYQHTPVTSSIIYPIFRVFLPINLPILLCVSAAFSVL